MNKNFLKVAEFEFIKTVRKKSFWASTLFLPIFIGLVSFVSGYSSVDASKKMESAEGLSTVYVYDKANAISDSFLVNNIKEINNLEEGQNAVKADIKSAFIYIPDTFYQDLKYEIYYSKDSDLLMGAKVPALAQGLIKQSAMLNVSNPQVATVLNGAPASTIYTYNEQGQAVKEGLERFILPIISLVVFFMAVYISSSYLLQSVSAEKENRMIETMLSIVDKKSLMFGKMLGLVGIVFVQLLTWVGFGLLTYYLVMNQFHMPIPIDFNNIDLKLLPLNIYLTVMGFLFFAAIMTGVGAVGTGAEDSRNLSSIFIILSIFPIYLLQMLITDPNSILAKVFSYFPFTSFMVLLMRNSLGALSTQELIFGIVLSLVYVIIAMWIALKLFELGCLMYNRRPSFKEMLGYLK